jgi:hypothetical protein
MKEDAKWVNERLQILLISDGHGNDMTKLYHNSSFHAESTFSSFFSGRDDQQTLKSFQEYIFGRCDACNDRDLFQVPMNSMIDCLTTHGSRHHGLLRFSVFPLANAHSLEAC